MKVAVVIGTWNRSRLLRETLLSLSRLRIPAGIAWQVVVVDNNSTDDTASILARPPDGLPLCTLFEARQGRSHALNKALDEISADWFVFTDDDVQVEEDWLESYCAAIRAHGDRVAFLGGPVVPWFSTTPDADLVAAIPTVGKGFCGTDVLQEVDIEEHGTPLPVGANFALSKCKLDGMRFDVNLGVSGRSRIGGEEHDLFRRLLAQKQIGRWIAAPAVRHYVPPERLTMRYLRRHLFDLGRTHIMTRGTPSGKRLLGIPGWILKEIAGSALGLMWYRFTAQRRSYYESFSQLCIRSGMAYQILVTVRSQGIAT